MSPLSIGLDGLLILLLGTAVMIGWRLNRKLKDLKDSQAGFVKAVGELDQAAIRAENGLNALRAATVEAHDQLLTRIETARGLSARLDRVLPETEAAAASADAAAQAALSAADAARRAAARAEAAPPAPRPVREEGAVVIALPTASAPPNFDRAAPAAPERKAERPGERAAALFLEERARRGLDADNDFDIPAERAPPLSRLARFKARRSGTAA